MICGLVTVFLADISIILFQNDFSCAEANLGAGAQNIQINLPLIVIAISEKLLPWPAYGKHYSKFVDCPETEESQGHFNPGVQAAASKVRAVTILFVSVKLS